MRFLLLSLISVGCTCGEKPCDPQTFSARCDGDAREYCRYASRFGFDLGSTVQRSPCTKNNVCHDFGNNQLGCAHAPITKCQRSEFKPACDGDTILICVDPLDSGLGSEDYVWASQCADHQTCGATELGPGCVDR